MGWRGLAAGGRTHKKKLTDVKQDHKIVPDLLESIMKPTDPIKEELRRILFKMDPRIQETRNPRIQGFKLLDVQKNDGLPPEANTASEPSKF